MKKIACSSFIKLLLVCSIALTFFVQAEELRYDSQNFQQEDQEYSISTNSQVNLEINILFSNTANDSTCRNANSYSWQTVSNSKVVKRSFSFSRQGSPAIALYEWHLCFEINGQVYKGWRGFDPGLNSKLRVNCHIDVTNLKNRSDKYLCSTNKLILNEKNYSEFAQYCLNKECKRFETEHEYNVFMNRDVAYIAAKLTSGSTILEKKEIKKTQLTDAQKDTMIEKMLISYKQSCNREKEKIRLSCLHGIPKIKTNLNKYTDWALRLTEQSLKQAFPLLKNQQLVPASYNQIDTRYQFNFVPHKANNNVVDRYVVSCSTRAIKSDALTHRCTLKSQQSFYMDEPQEHFEIEEFSNVQTALKAYRLLNKFDLNDISDERAKHWMMVSRVEKIALDGDYIIFNYSTEHCGISLEFKFINDEKQMFFVQEKYSYCF